MIYTTSILTEGENQEAELDVPEEEVEIRLEELEDGAELNNKKSGDALMQKH